MGEKERKHVEPIKTRNPSHPGERPREFARIAFSRSIAIPMALLVCSSLQAENSVKKMLVGDTKISVVKTYEGTRPLPNPSRTLVYGFDVSPEAISLDQSPAARILGHGPIAYLKHNQGRDDSRVAVAAHVQEVFSDTLVRDLNKASVQAFSVCGDDPQPV